MYLIWPRREFICGLLHHRSPSLPLCGLKREKVGRQPESDGLFQKTQGGFVWEAVKGHRQNLPGAKLGNEASLLNAMPTTVEREA